jgi:hypothetical protein
MTRAPIAEVFRIVRLDDPVLIAPKGRDYHDPQVLFRTWAGAQAWLDRPRCGAHADHWLAVDLDLAVMLERTRCVLCEALAETPKITDAEISAAEPSPESPGSTPEKEQP